MRLLAFIMFSMITTSIASAQLLGPASQNTNKGRLYIYWGWNLGGFSKSDIHFSGKGYDFTLSDVESNDRQSKYETDLYLNPGSMTIPQYNARIGYFFKENYSVSLGVDHMKYVMDQNQIVKFSGHIDSSASAMFGGYNSNEILLSNNFLMFEHTDGLNYINADVRRHEELISWKMFTVNLMTGLGAGALLPKTNAKLMENERYDEFHLAGYGFNGLVGVNLTVFRNFYVQSELKGGYINMPDIRTTSSTSDKASQSFWFGQLNIVFGATINLNGEPARPGKSK